METRYRCVSQATSKDITYTELSNEARPRMTQGEACGLGRRQEHGEEAGLKLGCTGKGLKELERKEKAFQESGTTSGLPEEGTLKRVSREKESDD